MIAARRVLFVADSHLPHEVAAVDEMVTYLDARLPATVAVYFLGDIFCYSVGMAGFRTAALDHLLAYLEALVTRGVDVAIVAGNRDFFLDRILPRHPRLTYTDRELDVAPFGERLHLVHGDTINTADRQYLLWRRVSRSRVVRGALSLLPGMAARALGDRLERTMRSTNAAYRIAFPEVVCRRYAEAAVAAGARRVLLGHFHEPRTMTIEVNGAHGTLHVVPDWLSRHTHAELWDDGRFVLDAADEPGA